MNTQLDINTPLGQDAACDQIKACNIVFNNSSDRTGRYSFVQTDCEDRAAIDGIILKDGIIFGVAEVKSRNMTEDDLLIKYHSEWLLTHQKLKDIAACSKLLRVPGFGLVYLKPSNCVYALKLSDEDGNICCFHRTEFTETQATINGGKAIRQNSYISVAKAKVFRDKFFEKVVDESGKVER